MSREYRDLAPEFPFLPGQRVCLNLDGPYYEQYNREQARGDAGYVTYIGAIENIVEQWKRSAPSTRGTYSVNVRWDNGHENCYNFGDLLLVDAPAKTSVVIEFHNGERVEGTEDTVWPRADELAIKRGYRVAEVITRDDAWRENLLNKLRTDIEISL